MRPGDPVDYCSEAGGFRRTSRGCGKKAGLAMSLYNNVLHFIFYPLWFEFIAPNSLFFPPGKATHILRGTPGAIFQKIAGIPDCTGAKNCAGNPTKGRARA
jgi:hypothetical protein